MTLPDPEHNVTIPYTRMLVGPMDYTPGAMNNATQKGFSPRDIDPMSMGTRCHQLAMFVVYESPLTVLADSPVNYDKAVGMDFISMVPTTWDDTRFLQGTVGDYIVLARKKGEAWYIGAMTDWEAREIEVFSERDTGRRRMEDAELGRRRQGGGHGHGCQRLRIQRKRLHPAEN